MGSSLIAIFDLDGTLLDSDDALAAPFIRLGIERSRISFGQPVDAECRRLGLTVDDYVAAYDTAEAEPFDGVAEMLSALGRWAVCSNKAAESATVELGRLGWHPDVARFADDFDWNPKDLRPVLSALAADPADVIFVGDTDHDARCAADVGCRFVWAGWNPRTRARSPEGIVLDEPRALLDLLG